MSVVIHLEVRDVGKGKPFETQWSLATMTKEQGIAAVKLMRILNKKLEEHVITRWPDVREELRLGPKE